MVQPQKLKDISKELQKILDTNMDQAQERRLAREAFKEIQNGINHCLMKIPYEGLKIEESYEVNSRGLQIFTKSWLPKNSRPKALVFFCHGYGETCTFTFEGVARKLALSGYGVFAMDYPGFGLSQGLHGYISSLEELVDDVVEQYSKVKAELEEEAPKNKHMVHLSWKWVGAQKQTHAPISSFLKNFENTDYSGLPSFLFGQSLGGAVALKVHLKQPNAWTGAILVAPMCKFTDNMIPPWILLKFLISIAYIFPKLKIVPHQNFVKMAFRDLRKRELAAYNVIAYKDTARLWTALECLRTTQELERRLTEVSLPLLILHGEADVVTDPSVSKALYEKASSSDKTFKLYKDAYHSLLEGETDGMIFQVLGDIIFWLDNRCWNKKQ